MRELTESEQVAIGGGAGGPLDGPAPGRRFFEDPVIYEWPIVPVSDPAIGSYAA